VILLGEISDARVAVDLEVMVPGCIVGDDGGGGPRRLAGAGGGGRHGSPPPFSSPESCLAAWSLLLVPARVYRRVDLGIWDLGKRKDEEREREGAAHLINHKQARDLLRAQPPFRREREHSSS
jgi:hypothetical protein